MESAKKNYAIKAFWEGLPRHCGCATWRTLIGWRVFAAMAKQRTATKQRIPIREKKTEHDLIWTIRERSGG